VPTCVCDQLLRSTEFIHRALVLLSCFLCLSLAWLVKDAGRGDDNAAAAVVFAWQRCMQ